MEAEWGLSRLGVLKKSLSAAQAALASENYHEAARLTGAAWRLGTGKISELRELFNVWRLKFALRTHFLLGARPLFAHQDANFDDRLAVIEFVSKSGKGLLLML